SRSRNRRSYPNLHSLSLAPLSTEAPFEPASPTADAPQTPYTSYIAQKSAPTTPGILSRSNSRTRSNRRRKHGSKTPTYAYHSYFPSSAHSPTSQIPKAASIDAIHRAGVSFTPDTLAEKQQPPARIPLVRHHTHSGSDEWIHRAGLAIAGETRDSKGQGWLVRRVSSTSLVGTVDDYELHPAHDPRHIALLSGEHVSDAEFARWSRAGSRMQSRTQSRMQSRVPSARTSRRGSRVGSRVDLMTTIPHSAMEYEDEENPFDTAAVEPDFVSGSSDDEDDEEEVARLARETGFGLGGWMDRLIGWTLFSVDEDGESDEDEAEEDSVGLGSQVQSAEDLKLKREVEIKRKKMEREAVLAAAKSNVEAQSRRVGRKEVEALEEEGGVWKDAAWLLGVATKVIL
ncbi:hypothetical protein M011DRAFT_371753, partial [Sporormia fimetaria CBS 119925]